MSQQAPELTEFAPDFHCRIARLDGDADLLQRVFELRFAVYCQECHFLPADDYPQGRESDVHDANSTHFCALSREGVLAGYARLVRPDERQHLPYQSYSGSVSNGATQPAAHESVEVSRLMVRQDYRRRLGTLLSGVSTDDSATAPQNERRAHKSQLLYCLYRSMYQYSAAQGIRYWYAAMERSLARIMTGMHFPIRQIGPSMDYYGPVAPYLLDLRDLERELDLQHPALMDWFRRQ